MRHLAMHVLLWAGLLLSGCGNLMSNGRRWGADATLTPGWDRVGEAALSALKAPEVWMPAAVALALQVEDFDERISDWALRHHPVFGNEEDAGDASDDLRAATLVSYGVTFLATPSGSLDSDWGVAKLKGLAVGLAAQGLTGFSTHILKDTTDRERPNKENDRSFPSAHASRSAVYAILADQNVRTMTLPRWVKVTAKVGLTALPLATGWARVEAAKHYPADILAGVALGHFFGLFINDAFMGLDQDVFLLSVEPRREGVFASVTLRF